MNRIKDTNELKCLQQLMETRANIPQRVIDEAICRWQVWLCACVKTKDHHLNITVSLFKSTNIKA